jgi:hypothetical protein
MVMVIHNDIYELFTLYMFGFFLCVLKLSAFGVQFLKRMRMKDTELKADSASLENSTSQVCSLYYIHTLNTNTHFAGCSTYNGGSWDYPFNLGGHSQPGQCNRNQYQNKNRTRVTSIQWENGWCVNSGSYIWILLDILPSLLHVLYKFNCPWRTHRKFHMKRNWKMTVYTPSNRNLLHLRHWRKSTLNK